MRLVVCFLLLLLPGTGLASELHLILNGWSYHFERDRGYNENNYGIGFEYDFNQRGNWIPLITGSTFKDSNEQTSNYLGGGAKYRFLLGKDKKGLHIDAGAVGFVMTRKDRNDNEPFLGALPFVSVGNHFFAVNATYIPQVTPKTSALVYFQLMFKLAEF
jgi:hypothetical protein